MANAMETRVDNTLAVLRAVHARPGIAKPQVCQQCGLAASTVQSIVTQLLAQGVLSQLGSADSTGGRKAQRYSINPGHKTLVAASLRAHRADIGILDLSLAPLHQKQLNLTLGGTGPETYAAALIHEIQALLAANGISPEMIAGIGVGVPAPTDLESGAVQEMAEAPLWCGFPLGNRIASAMGLPVWVDKDAYLGIRHLQFSHQIEPGQTVVYLTICEGVSAALMAGGHILRGSHGLAGEVGHITIRRDGARCHCGNTGCLALYCSDTGIVAQYNAQSEENCSRIDEIIHRSGKGDEIARRVFAQAVRYLVDMTSSLIMNYDPDEIVIDCMWLHMQKALYFSLLDGLYAKSIFTRKHRANLRLLEPQDFYLKSAAAIAGGNYLFSKDSPLIASVQ